MLTDFKKSYAQYCPISHALDILGERWSLLILRDMLVGATKFNQLSRGLPGLSRTLLSKRLRDFENAGLVRREGVEYLLTESGRDLRTLVFALGDWGATWAFDAPAAHETDAELLVWWMHSRIDTSLLPDRRVVLYVDFSDDDRDFWLLVEEGSVSVCLVDPLFPVDVTLHSDRKTLYEIWLGRRPIRSAIRSGELSFSGDREVRANMIEVLQLSPIAPIVTASQNRN